MRTETAKATGTSRRGWRDRKAGHRSASSSGALGRRGQAGFTLIELLIATAIISVLAGVAVFAVGRAKDNAHKNACLTELRAFETALNTAEFEGQSIAPWISSNVGKYFQVTGSLSFGPNSTSPLDGNCD